MRENSAKYFCNKECECYPCHPIGEDGEFNCLFCYCPLYALGKQCGGNFRFNEKGIKDCSGCMVPHAKGGYEHVMERVREVVRMTVRLGSGN